MSDQEAMSAMASNAGNAAQGMATNMSAPASYPTGMSMPTNPQGWSGQQGVAGDQTNWLSNLFSGGNWNPDDPQLKKWGAIGSIGQAMNQQQQQRGALAAPVMPHGGGYPVQPTQRQAPVLALIHPSTRIY